MQTKETAFDYDLFVIGAGSGGVRASRMAASFGKKVAIAEDRHLGGTCVNVGCVPKKLFVYAAHFHEEFEAAHGYGWSGGQSQFNWATLRANKDQEIQRLNAIYSDLLENSAVQVIYGNAKLVSPHKVVVNNQHYRAKHILIATGSAPFVPHFQGANHIVTSTDMFYLKDLPHDAIVVGGGYIAVEFAGILAGLGVKVTQLYRGAMFLRGFDDEVRHFLAKEMEKKGIGIKFHAEILAIEKTKTGRFMVTFKDGTVSETGLVLYATGRLPKTKNLGLESLGVALDRHGAIKVNHAFQSSVPSIYALGDVINRVTLTPVAIREAMILTQNLYGNTHQQMDYDNIPTAVFSTPSIGTVGHSEESARKTYDKIQVFRSEFRPMKFTLSGGAEKAFIKLIVDAATDKVVGAHMVGADAAEIIQGIGIALKAGAKKADFDATIGIHPTSAEEFVTMRQPN